MSKLPPRGSARFHNLMFRTALERAKEQIDYAIDVLKQDGYPPLTTPLTLSALNKIAAEQGPEQAVHELQMELRRTMKQDEVTRTPVPDDKTLQLIRDYMQTQQTPQEREERPA